VLRPNYFWAALLTCLLVPATSQAGFVITGSGGSFQSLSGYSLNENGSPFFDNASGDGSQKNIGFFLTKTGGFSTNSLSPAIPQSQLSFWGTGTGAADPIESFSSGGAGVGATFVLTVAGNAGVNVLGYHDSLGDHVLYDPTVDGPVIGQTETFTPVGNFAFYLHNPGPNYFFYSDTSLGGTDGSQQHFAVFQQTGSDKLWLGVEDLPGSNHGEGLGDFNDVIFSIQLVPEPGGLTVFGVGVLSLAGYGWRRRRQLPPLAAA
jgi:hypothetical protein